MDGIWEYLNSASDGKIQLRPFKASTDENNSREAKAIHKHFDPLLFCILVIKASNNDDKYNTEQQHHPQYP